MSLQLYVLRINEGREPSPFVWRARLALRHKGLDYERVPIGYGEKDRLGPSGQGLVPVLVDAGRWIHDSWAIACHLEDAWPDRPSLFGGEAGRGAALFVNRWADVEMLGALRLLLWPPTWDHIPIADQPYFKADRETKASMTLDAMREDADGKIARFRRTMEPARQTIQRQRFLGGERPGYADFAVLGGFLWARSISELRLIERDDPLHRWRADVLASVGDFPLGEPGHAL